MRICIAQTRHRVSGLNETLDEFKKKCEYALQNNVDIVVFPFLFVGHVGYENLLNRPEFLKINLDCINFIKNQTDNRLCVVFGHYDLCGGEIVDCVSVVSGNEFVLTTREVNVPVLFKYREQCIAVLNFEDRLLFKEIGDGLRTCLGESQYLLIPSKSCFTREKNNLRLSFFERVAIENDMEVAYANLYGVHDSVVFDGLSFFINKHGKLIQAREFEEDTLLNEGFHVLKFDSSFVMLDRMISALVTALREYVCLAGFDRVHLGISGGIDSAVVAYLACYALGSDKVIGISMPSRFSSDGSVSDAKELARGLGFGLINMPIEVVFSTTLEFLSAYFNTEGITEENLQARLRGLLLMSYSNANRSLLLNTGNKSEVAVGYCTLYGDSCGGIALIGDLFKGDVYELAKHINLKEGRDVIPINIILKEPSAELRPEQKDSDSIPRYEVLDEILTRYLIENEPLDLLYEAFGKELVTKVLDLYSGSEYKRRQGAMVVKVSRSTFGNDILLPVSGVELAIDG
ncbi:NAD(+) synthase [Borrelia sp. BU AG58]|uniref:NAD(+) synthase n=1 Tax=Borrelia sp. BU AG58 TaxID=2887345 RepID=UPI001E30B7D7|nr:NAD(+) synthase [Borrelia sp. BU AG58]UER67687.1 NAD(+) synthase [Borrelia sp. BU AG58]